MGCGNSKLQPEGEGVPNRLGPLLRRNLDEIRRRKKASGSGSYSKKELLDHDESCRSPSRSTNDHDGNSSSSREGSPKSKDIARVTPWPECGDNMKETKEAINQEDNKYKEDHKKDVELPKDAITAAIEMLNELEEEDKNDDGERLSCVDERCLCPGSPSFRVYIDHDIETESNNESDQGQDDSQASKISNSEESGELLQPTSLDKTKKMGKRGRRFREVIAKGRQASMKNLLNVKSRYSAGCTGNDNTRLIK